MEVNDFLPTHVRVFSDSSGGFNPEILKNVLHLDLEGLDKTKVSELLNDNKTDELYRYLLLTQCNALNSLLPEMFERMGAYTEMLLPNNILRPEGVIGRLVKDIPEDDFRDAVQIIGWLYQYYNTEPKQAVFDGLKKNIKITKENIPAATQLFTPDWIVRYMVENSLGRLWLESRPGSSLRAHWKYYLDEAEQTPEVAERLRVLRSENAVKSPEDIKVIDPCMGSGHILVYAFDVLMQIYTSEGYSERDAAKLILEKNLYGLEIDRRAYQLAYFVLMMKARQYNRRILTQSVRPQVFEPTGYVDGMEYGSLIHVDKLEPMPEQPEGQLTLFDESYDAKLNAWNFRRLLAQKYDVVVTNPPYLGNKSMSNAVSSYLKTHYDDYKMDMFAAMIAKCINLCSENGKLGFMTPFVWMFISNFSALRTNIINNTSITSLIQLEYSGFDGATVPICTFTLSKSTVGATGEFIKLSSFRGVEQQQIKTLEAVQNKNCGYRYSVSTKEFSLFPDSVIAYWASFAFIKLFADCKSLGSFYPCKKGMTTGDNNRFLRLWHEIRNTDVGTRYKFYCKGGGYRRWYGNLEDVIDWIDDGRRLREFKGATLRNEAYYFKKAVTWGLITSNLFSARAINSENAIGDAGPICVCSSDEFNYVLGYLNSIVSTYIMDFLNPTMNFSSGVVGSLPYITTENVDSNYVVKIDNLVEQNKNTSRADWDAFETSWDFKRHPLISGKQTIAAAFAKWEREAMERFDTLKTNEEELNRIFIDIYGLQEELTPEVEDKDVSVRRADLGREIRSLISYAVGCMLGRYSLDSDGLAYAGGDWDAGKYKTLPADKDNILPICDDEYFDDDIAGRFVEFVKTVYGEDTLEENLRFIADALGGKGTPREVIRNYFLNDFYKDHLKIYQKRPIYWLFDSGKKNGFKALIYMHRYSSDLLAKLRTDYVHEQQERYRTQLSHISGALNTATGAERARLLKQQEKLTEQLREITVFEEKVHHLADQKITIDLDDGVKKNYAIFTDVLAKI